MSEQTEDALLPFMFKDIPVRGVLLQSSAQWRELHRRHDYAPAVRDLLGQATAATAVIASSMKFEGMLTVQMVGAGALGMLIAQSNHELGVRGMAGELRDDQPADSFEALIGAGQLTLTVDARDAKDRYRGIVGVRGASLASALSDYYRESAQLAAHFVLLADEQHCAALMLQRMPEREGLDSDDWRRLCLMADTLTLEELGAGVGAAMIGKLYAEDDVVVWPHRDVRFSCRCNAERAERAVRMLGEEDARALLAERDNRIEIICEFCNQKRVLDAVDVGRLFNPGAMRNDDVIH